MRPHWNKSRNQEQKNPQKILRHSKNEQLQGMLLYQWAIEEIGGINEIPRTNENTSYLWDAGKAVLSLLL
jgi:hypothetical protein